MYNEAKFFKYLEEQIQSLHHKTSKIMDTMDEIVAKLTALGAQVQKIGTESKATLQAVADLKAALANQPGVTQQLQDAVDNVVAQVKVVDDLVPDSVPAPADGGTAQG